MEKDKLKSFIQSHKEDFESDVPGNQVWESIAKEFDPNEDKEIKVIPIKRFYSLVASIVIVFGLGIVYLYTSINDNTEVVENEKPELKIEELSFASLSNDLAEVENYYITEVNDKLEMLKSYEVDEEILEEVNLLSEEFDRLKVEMGQSVDPQLIVEAMIENYRLRLDILEDLLNELKQENKSLKTKESKRNEMV